MYYDDLLSMIFLKERIWKLGKIWRNRQGYGFWNKRYIWKILQMMLLVMTFPGLSVEDLYFQNLGVWYEVLILMKNLRTVEDYLNILNIFPATITFIIIIYFISNVKEDFIKHWKCTNIDSHDIVRYLNVDTFKYQIGGHKFLTLS